MDTYTKNQEVKKLLKASIVPKMFIREVIEVSKRVPNNMDLGDIIRQVSVKLKLY